MFHKFDNKIDMTLEGIEKLPIYLVDMDEI